jgi:uncharacterized membrane protein YccF (DUF307 family)
MNLLGNIIWLVFGGFFMFLNYLLGGIILCFTIIGIPFGLQLFKIAGMALWPFGSEIVHKEGTTGGCLYTMMNLIWIIIGGFWTAIGHVLLGLFFYITIIGIPFGNQHFKMAGLTLTPFGLEIREKQSNK